MKIVFLDTETTGLDPMIHVPIEIAMGTIETSDPFECTSIYTSTIACSHSEWEAADTMALEVNGFNPECIWNSRSINVVSEEIIQYLVRNNVKKENAYFMCQNPSFDRMFFNKIVPESVMINNGFPSHWLDLTSYFLGSSSNKFNSLLGSVKLSKDDIAKILGLNIERKPHKALSGMSHLMACFMILNKAPAKQDS